jgi:hypothetical protein
MENRGVIEGCQGKQAVPVKGAMLLLVALFVIYSLRSGGHSSAICRTNKKMPGRTAGLFC